MADTFKPTDHMEHVRTLISTPIVVDPAIRHARRKEARRLFTALNRPGSMTRALADAKRELG